MTLAGKPRTCAARQAQLRPAELGITRRGCRTRRVAHRDIRPRSPRGDRPARQCGATNWRLRVLGTFARKPPFSERGCGLHDSCEKEERHLHVEARTLAWQ